MTIREENAIAALEVMSRFAVDPRWLVYLPPTMSPTATSDREGMLEHPHEAFAAYRAAGVEQVVCEEKHMGSRAVVVVCRDSSVAARRFGDREYGRRRRIFTRTGRPFFSDAPRRQPSSPRSEPVSRLPGLWDELSTDWLVLDCELAALVGQGRGASPPSVRVGRCRGHGRAGAETAALEQAVGSGRRVGELVEHVGERVRDGARASSPPTAGTAGRSSHSRT